MYHGWTGRSQLEPSSCDRLSLWRRGLRLASDEVMPFGRASSGQTQPTGDQATKPRRIINIQSVPAPVAHGLTYSRFTPSVVHGGVQCTAGLSVFAPVHNGVRQVYGRCTDGVRQVYGSTRRCTAGVRRVYSLEGRRRPDYL